MKLYHLHLTRKMYVIDKVVDQVYIIFKLDLNVSIIFKCVHRVMVNNERVHLTAKKKKRNVRVNEEITCTIILIIIPIY